MRKILPFLCIFGMLLLSASPLYAGGFGITEKGVKGLGNAYSGGAASADDASTIWWNPAGMTRLDKKEVDVALFLVKPSFEYTSESAINVTALPPINNPNPTIPGGNGGDAGGSHIVGNVFYSHNFSDQWYAGVGITVPFGLGTEYDSDWVGRYHGIKSEILTLDINPSVAYAINQQWSVGGGISFQYLDAELTSAVDYETIGVLIGAIAPAPGIGSNPALDGTFKLTGDNWGFGFNLGVLFELSENTRFGLQYRSKISQDLEGDAEFVTPAASQGIANAVGNINQAVKADLDLPASASLSAYHMLNPKWALMGDVTYTQWDELQELRIKFSVPGKADQVTSFKWDNTWRVSGGATWLYSDAWTWRGGIAWDQTPVPDARYRTTGVPDEDRVWLALGGSWNFASAWSVDFAGTYIWTTTDPKLDKTFADAENTTRGALKGSYKADSIVAGVQINYMF